MDKIQTVKLNPGKYSLIRQRDGAGDAGPVLICYKIENGQMVDRQENGVLKVGYNVECGSITARTYSAQDYWLTTEITEFIDVDPEGNSCTFKTGNSVYEAKVI